MATIVNARDVILQATSPRLEPVQLPDNFGVDFSNVNGDTRPADYADVTVAAVNGGIVVTGGGITLSSGGSIKGGQTAYATGTGFFLGWDTTAYKFSIGNTTNYLKWTGSGLDLAGNLTGTSSISITGTASFGGVSTVGGDTFAVVANSSLSSTGGIRAYSVTGAAFHGTSNLGYGVYGEAAGSAIAVYAKGGSSTDGGAAIYATSAIAGVFGQAVVQIVNTRSLNSGPALGVQGTTTMSTSGASDIVLTVDASGATAGAAKFFGPGTKEVWLAPGSYAIYSPTGGGKYYVVDGIGPFTGMHPGFVLRGESNFVPGDIVVDDEILEAPDVSNAFGTVKLSQTACERAAIGVVNEVKEMTIEFTYEQWWRYAPDYMLMDINALGEGLVNVCGEGGTIFKGDLIVTSNTPGKGMRQSDDLVRSFTVARARETVTFDNAGQVKACACIYLCG